MNFRNILLSPIFLLACVGDDVSIETEGEIPENVRVCGNDIVEGSEECDNSFDDSCVNCKKARKVFLSEKTYQGSELSKADDICNELASENNIKSTCPFKAFLSKNTEEDAIDNVCHEDNLYVKLNNQIVAYNCEDLTNGTINTPINMTETESYLENVSVWTGSDEYGTWYLHTCQNWSKNDRGVIGNSSETDLLWVNSGEESCENFNHIYCFELTTC